MYKFATECHCNPINVESLDIFWTHQQLRQPGNKVDLILKGEKHFHVLEWLCRIVAASYKTRWVYSHYTALSIGFHPVLMRKIEDRERELNEFPFWHSLGGRIESVVFILKEAHQLLKLHMNIRWWSAPTGIDTFQKFFWNKTKASCFSRRGKKVHSCPWCSPALTGKVDSHWVGKEILPSPGPRHRLVATDVSRN